MSQDDEAAYAHEMAAAFAHEIRTPLTSLAMALELTDAGASEGELHLDAGLTALVRASLDGLNGLADEFQDASRLARGKLVLAKETLGLLLVVQTVRDLLAPAVTLILLDGPPDRSIVGDPARLPHALAGIAGGVYRCGDGSGDVRLGFRASAISCSLEFTGGEDRGGTSRIPGPEAGYGFFAGRAILLASGADVEIVRRDGFMRAVVTLPVNGS